MGHEEATADPARGEVDRLPLTPMQFGMVFESTVGGRPSANVEQVVCHLDDEEVDPSRLEAAWRAVQRRHDVLRTSFALEGRDGPVQLVHAESRCDLDRVDWSPLDPEQQAASLEAWLSSDRALGIDLDRAPGMRLALLELGPTRSVLVWTFHHALLDGRSFSRVLEEVFDRYDGLAPDDPGAEALPSPAFRHHVEAVATADRDAARAYFGELLDGFDRPVPAPGAVEVEPVTDVGHAPARPDPVGHAEVEVRLSQHLVDRLEKRAAEADATLGTMLLVAWSVVVSRYTARTDVVFGTTRSGRHTVPGASEIVGCLINTVPIRLRTGAERSVDELIRGARAFQLDVRPHEHTALVDVQSWSEVPNDQRLLSSNVVFERELLDSRLRRRGGAWSARRVEVLEQTSFPLVVAAYVDDGLLLRLEFDRSCYQRPVVEDLSAHLAQILTSLADSAPDTRIDELRMLDPRERSVLLDERNPARPDAPTETLVARFERQARQAPTRIAVEALAGGPTRTYAELDERANRLAGALRDAGATSDRPVAICLARSAGFVEAVLAVLKAGAAYLPLDPTYPEASLGHMLADSGATIVVATRATSAHLPATGARVLLVDDLEPLLAEQPAEAPARPLAALDDVAYVIYTSGSTGAPKGVMVSHGSLAAYCDAVIERYGLSADDRKLQFASLSFDVSVEELLPSLGIGATVVLRDDEVAESMAALVEATERAGLTVLNLPSAIWHALVEHLEDHGARLAATVRLVVVGGEKVSRGAYEAWARTHPEVPWLNGYGPTETTITATSYDPVAGGYELGSGREIPIGTPLANTRAYVLGGGGRWLVPDGAVGELWIGGSSVALGYLGQPELTASRFRADPFTGRAGDRMYGTGDLVRWLPSGDLEFLGRNDRQLKLRGFRIEPGEVERVLERHPAVRQAFVALRTDPASDQQRLAAWVVLAPQHGGADLDAILAEARRGLPAHAVPSALVATDDLARTAGGKVDVDALPAPFDARQHRPASAPATGDEARLGALFGDVLGVTAGPDDSFFDLGGHSLLAVRLISRLEQAVGTRVSLATLHAAPTPRALAAVLHDAVDPDQLAYLAPIQPSGDRPPLYGIHVLGFNGSFYRPLASHLGADQPVLGLSIAEPGEDTPTAVAEIAALYVDEIVRYQPQGPLSLAAVSLGGYVAFEVAQQLTARGRQVAVVALLDSPGPGGRTSVTRGERLAIHLRKLRTGRHRYVAMLARRHVETVRQRIDGYRIRLHGILGHETPDELWQHRFVLANIAAADRYQARPYPGRLTVFHAAGEEFDAVEAVRAGLGWDIVAAGGLDVVEVPGEHVSMLEDPHVAALADALRAAMDRALAAG